MRYFVYILECVDNTLYCGSTNDIEKRVKEHNSSKNGAKYTRGRRPVDLGYFEVCKNYGDARKREAEIKRMKRKQKDNLIKIFRSSK